MIGIERDLSRPVSNEEVGSALLALVALGFVDAYVYDAANSRYRRVTAETSAIEKLWFLISEAGRLESDGIE